MTNQTTVDGTPFERLSNLLLTMRGKKQRGDGDWNARSGEVMPLVDLITDPDEQQYISSLCGAWIGIWPLWS